MLLAPLPGHVRPRGQLCFQGSAQAGALRLPGTKRGLFIILFSPFRKGLGGGGGIGTLSVSSFPACPSDSVGFFSRKGSSSPREGPRSWGSDHTVCVSEVANDESFIFPL